jgi:hypothetical protein
MRHKVLLCPLEEMTKILQKLTATIILSPEIPLTLTYNNNIMHRMNYTVTNWKIGIVHITDTTISNLWSIGNVASPPIVTSICWIMGATLFML